MRPFSVSKPPPLSIILQAAFLKAAQPDSTYHLTGHSGLIWRGRLQPTPLSDSYEVRIQYTLGHYPEIDVLSPTLMRRGEEPIPHMYGQKTLCLFNPNKREWNSKMRIDRTILPWTSVWLFFYEIWQATGEWKGGGDHPPLRQPRLDQAA